MRTASKSFPAATATYDTVTGRSYSSQHYIFTVGAGYLDIWAALSDSTPVNGAAISPTAVYDAASRSVRVINTQSAQWGESALWGESVLWGTSAVWGNTLVRRWGLCIMGGIRVVRRVRTLGNRWHGRLQRPLG
jgi:serine protease AprX